MARTSENDPDPGCGLARPWVESPFFESVLAKKSPPEHLAQLARQFHTEGYAILEDVIDPELVEAVVDDYPRLFDPATRFAVPRPMQRLLAADPTRKQDAWRVSRAVRELACQPAVLEILRFLYDREPVPFQTLNFLPGTQQSAHSDDVHFSSMPAGFMCGVWIALEDVTEANGPLFYYPGSQRVSAIQLDELGLTAADETDVLGENYLQVEHYLAALIEAHGLERRQLCIRKGQALIWAANLIHGGCAIQRPESTRMSQVTHFYFEDCVYYTPIFSNSRRGDWWIRDVFDVRTGKRVRQNLDGAPVRFARAGRAGRARNGRRRIVRPRRLPQLIRRLLGVDTGPRRRS